jgi:hypothetical protein
MTARSRPSASLSDAPLPYARKRKVLYSVCVNAKTHALAAIAERKFAVGEYCSHAFDCDGELRPTEVSLSSVIASAW